MDDDSMNPTVTLNANVDPYVQGMNQAAEATKRSAAAIGVLFDKTHQLYQNTSKGFQIVGAGTLASLTALALAADGANKQLNTLQASAAITGKNFGAFRDSVASISSSMPKSRDEIANLTISISQLGVTSQKQVDEFTRLFAKMGSATGGSPQLLADQMIKLSRTMGTMDTQSVTKFSNALTFVSTSLGTSAEGAAQFANSIAPFTRAAGIGESATLGLGAAFSKSGSDGMVAANTFAQITSDITTALASGSPEIKKYSAALGMTVDQFKSMDAAERVVKIFEKISTSGKSAGVILESLGIEGPRTARAIQQAVAETGGIRKAVGLADSSNGNSINTGSNAANDNISDQFIKIRNSSRATADALGEPLVGPLKVVARSMAAVTQAGTTMAQIFAPLLKLVVPLAAAFVVLGTAMKAMAVIQLLGTAAGLTARGALGGGLLGGMRSVTGAPQSAVGQMYEERMAPGYIPPSGGRQLTAYERSMYTMGRGVGNVREMLSSGLGSRSLMQTGAIGGLKGVQLWNNWSSDFAKQMGMPGPDRDWTPAQNLINKFNPNSNLATANLPASGPGAPGSPGVTAPGFFGQGKIALSSIFNPEETAARRAGLKAGIQEFKSIQDINEKYAPKIAEIKEKLAPGNKLDKELKKITEQVNKELESVRQVTADTLKKATEGMSDARKASYEAGKTVGAMGKNFGSWAKVASADLRGLASMSAKVLSAPLRAFGAPMLAITAGLFAWQQIKKARDDDKKNTEAYAGQSGLKDYYAAIGQTSPNQTSLQDVLKNQEKVVAKNTNFAQATDITGAEYNQASTSGRKMTDSRFRKMSDQEILAYLRINNFDLKANPELLSEVTNDIIQATGSAGRAQAILTAYSNGASTPGGAPQNSNAASGVSPIQGSATATDYKARAQFYQKEAQGGWWTRNLGIGGAPEGLVAALEQDTTAAQNTAGALQNIYGSDGESKTNIGAAAAAMATNATISSLPQATKNFNTSDNQNNVAKLVTGHIPTWLSGVGVTGKDADAQRIWSQQIRTLEKQYGIDPVGFSYTDFMSWSNENHMNIRDPSQVNAALYQYLNTKGDRGKALGAAMYGDQGQYAGKTASQIQNSLSNDISNFKPTQNSATKKKMEIVSKMTGNKSGGNIYASTLTPTSGGGMSDFAKSMAETGSEELKYAAAVKQASAAVKASNGDYKKAIATLGELAYNAGPNTQEAAIYTKAQEIASPQEQIKSMQVSPIANLKNTVETAQNTLKNSQDPTAQLAAQNTLAQADSTLRQFLLSIKNFNKSISRAETDFNIQQKYAKEDYARSIKYMVEDVAKSQTGYTRPSGQSTISGAAYLQNENSKTDLLDKQLANLRKAKALGISNAVIQQLDLANPANQAQLERFLKEWEKDPAEVKAFNKAEARKIQSTSDMLKSGFVDAFNRTDQQFKISMTRMNDSFNLSMSRAKTDFNDTMTGMTGDITKLFNTATSKASAGIQALGGDAKKNLQGVFNEMYQVDVKVTKGGGTTTATNNVPGVNGAGTVVPVRSPGATGRRIGAPDSPAVRAGIALGGNDGTSQYVDWSEWGTADSGMFGSIAYAGGNFGRGRHFYNGNIKKPDSNFINDSVKNIGEWVPLNRNYWEWVPKGYHFDGPKVWTGGTNWSLIAPRAYGGSVDAGKSYVVGEKGPELLQGVSGHIMPSSSFQSSVARETVQMMRVAGFANQTTYKGGGTTHVDNSTKIMGGQFTVVTADPDAMGRQLKGKDRLERLRTGKRTP